MSSQPNQDHPDIPIVVGRRSARLSIVIPITIKGVDAKGQAFKENTWTIGVNKQGAKIATFCQFTVGDHITVENPVLGRSAKAHVIRVGEKRFPEDPYEIGIELNEAQNVWGIKFPPEDWQRGVPITPGGRLPARMGEPGGDQQALKPAVPPPAQAGETPKPEAAPPEMAADAREHAEKFSQFNMAVEALSRFAKEAEKTAEAQPPAGEARPAKPSEAFDFQKRAGLPQAAERQDEREKLVRSLPEQLSRMAEFMRTTRTELETLPARFQELQRGWQAEIEKTQRSIQEGSRQAVESATRELEEKLRRAVEKASASFFEETRKRAQEESAAAAESFSKEASARLAALMEVQLAKAEPQLQAPLSRATEQAREQISQLMQAAAAEFSEKLRKAADEMAPSLRQEMEKSLENLAAQLAGQFPQKFQEQAQKTTVTAQQSLQDNLQTMRERIQQELETRTAAEAENARKQLAALSTTALEGFQHYTEAQVDGLRNELKETLERFQEKAVGEVSERLQGTADELLESSGRLLQRQAEDASVMASEKLSAATKETLEETQKQLTALSQRTREALAQETRLAAEEYRGQLRRTVEEFHTRSTQELESRLQGTAAELQEGFSKQLQQETDQARERVLAELRSKSERAAQEASDSVYRQAGLGAAVLKDWADQAKSRLEASFESSLEAFQKQIAEFSKTTLEKHRKESTLLLAELHSRLQQASRAFEEKEPETDSPKTK